MILNIMPLLMALLFSSQDYELNRSRSRTSSIIQEGNINLMVQEPFQHEEYGKVHKVELKVKIRVAYSNKEESSEFYLPTSYFTPEFWDELKEVDYLELPDFDIKHIKSISSICNEVLIFNFKRDQGTLINNDATIKSQVCIGLEGIGAKYLDMSGTANGFAYKAGFDAVL